MSEVIIGHEVLCIPLEQIRRLGELPADVQVLAVLPDPSRRRTGFPRAWIHEAPAPFTPPLYLRIAHQFCVRVRDGQVYMISELDEFLERYRALSE